MRRRLAGSVSITKAAVAVATHVVFQVCDIKGAVAFQLQYDVCNGNYAGKAIDGAHVWTGAVKRRLLLG